MIKRNRGRPVGTGLNGRTRFLSDSELQAFFKCARKSKRDDLLFNLVLFFGLRSREAAELKIDNFDFQNLSVTIRGLKHGLERSYEEVPSVLWHKLRMYLKIRKGHAKNPYLFPHRFLEDKHMTPTGAQGLFLRICKKAGITAHSIHDLRHTAGTRLAMMNLSANRIARHLRQRDSASSNRYVDLRDDREADKTIRQGMGVF